jgi:ketosteroid isomerase-like protein
MSRADIDALNAAFVQGAEEHDAARIAACYAPDAQLLPPGSQPLTGAAIEQFWGRMLDAGVEGGALKTLSLEEDGDRAIEVGHYEMRAGGQLADTGNYVVVHHRQPDGSWKYGVDIFNSDRPAPAA